MIPTTCRINNIIFWYNQILSKIQKKMKSMSYCNTVAGLIVKLYFRFRIEMYSVYYCLHKTRKKNFYTVHATPTLLFFGIFFSITKKPDILYLHHGQFVHAPCNNKIK